MDNPDVKRVIHLLRTSMRILDVSNREVERRLGLSPSYLSRLFSGAIELRLEHVLDITRAIGLRPEEFFRLAFPDHAEPPSEAATQLREVLREFQPPARAAGAAPQPSPEEIEQRILDSVRRLLAESRLPPEP